MRVLVKKEVLFHADPLVREAALETLAAAFAVPRNPNFILFLLSLLLSSLELSDTQVSTPPL